MTLGRGDLVSKVIYRPGSDGRVHQFVDLKDIKAEVQRRWESVSAKLQKELGLDNVRTSPITKAPSN